MRGIEKKCIRLISRKFKDTSSTMTLHKSEPGWSPSHNDCFPAEEIQ